jgi:CubicO group peptidase (beta-lactamase class C family)
MAEPPRKEGFRVADLGVETDPSEVGFDSHRLARIDRHFQQYVDDGRLPGWLLVITRAGKVAHLATYGMRDVEAGAPVEVDTLFRIYSMTKPITSVAAMICYEEGLFELSDPVSRFIPSFADVKVFRGGSSVAPVTEPATEPVRIWHLLTHTAGLTYGFHFSHPVDALYRGAGFELGSPPDMDLAQSCDTWASFPLLFQPGTSWNYSVATDVLGRVVEVASGQGLDDFFAERIFGPLDMSDSRFFVEGGDVDRLAALYIPDRKSGRARQNAQIGGAALRPPPYLSGGGGLVSSAADYQRFAEMLRQRGALDGVRLLGPRTVDYMAENHLPGGVDIAAFGTAINAEAPPVGIGFGLGFGVTIDPVAAKVLSTKGEYSWGGAASTTFWVDPAEELSVVFLTQLLPSSTHPLRSQLRQLVYQAIVD